jgi:putative PIN family toxin of toxin-antitoxin system
MQVVLDSNVLLVSIPRSSVYRPIFDALLQKRFGLVISTEILAEYEELIEQKANGIVAANIAEMLINLENVHFQEIYFKWNLIEKDPDDDKFADVTIASGADYLVTEDRHFNVLRTLDFPKVTVIGAGEFLQIIQS